MRVTLAGLSSQYIHVTLAPWCLRHAARKAGRPEEITLCEMNINEPAEQIMRKLMETRPDLLGFSVYIWNRSLTGGADSPHQGGVPGAAHPGGRAGGHLVPGGNLSGNALRLSAPGRGGGELSPAALRPPGRNPPGAGARPVPPHI